MLSELAVKGVGKAFQEGRTADARFAVDELSSAYFRHPLPLTHGLWHHQNACGSLVHSLWFYVFLLVHVLFPSFPSFVL